MSENYWGLFALKVSIIRVHKMIISVIYWLQMWKKFWFRCLTFSGQKFELPAIVNFQLFYIISQYKKEPMELKHFCNINLLPRHDIPYRIQGRGSRGVLPYPSPPPLKKMGVCFFQIAFKYDCPYPMFGPSDGSDNFIASKWKVENKKTRTCYTFHLRFCLWEKSDQHLKPPWTL